MKKIIAFGDSFLAGTELPSVDCTWPALIAKRLGIEFETRAVAGCGNDRIAEQIYQWFTNHPVQNVLAVVNWTWTSRWDLYLLPNHTRDNVGFPRWLTLGPSCTPSQLSELCTDTHAGELVDFYNHTGGHSLLWNVFRNLQTVQAVQSFMWHQGIVSVQTYMDKHLVKDSNNDFPTYIHRLQQHVKQRMYNFEGLNFLDWSRQHGHEVTEPGLHPLQSAHIAAADYWESKYSQLLGI